MKPPATVSRPDRRPGAWAGLALLAALAAPGAASAQGGGPPAVDSLLERGRLQEAAWALRDAGDTARAEVLLARLEAILRDPPVRARPLGMDSQGVSFTWRLDHGQGVASIFKVDGSDIFCPACGADREVATYRIDRLLGFDLTPVTVMTRIVKENGDTASGSTMYFVNDAVTPRDAGAEKPDRLRLFDAIIGNSDRHQANWLIVAGRVVAIDHNRAFEYQPTTRPKTCWETEIDSIAEPGGLGAPWQRYRDLPTDSIRTALAGLEPALADRMVDMRDRIVARLQARIERPRRRQPLSDCAIAESE
jgi:hypothetical protein